MLVVWSRLSTLTAVPPLIIAFTCLHVYRFVTGSLFWVSHDHTNTDAVQPQALLEDRGGGWAITPEIDDYASRALAAEHLPGLSIAVVRITNVGEVEVDMAAWGRMNEDGKQTNVDTLFNIGSCSKAFLVAAIGVLMEDFSTGKNVTKLPPPTTRFDWDTRVQDILPAEFSPIFASPWTRAQMTIRDILSHMSGLGSHDFVYGDDESPSSLLRHLQHLRPVYELRERFSYTNLFYTIGAYIISVYSGMSYEDFVAERIFTPLGMFFTTYSQAEAAATGRLSQSWISSGRRIPLWLGNKATTAWSGPAGIISNVVDMSKWLVTLLNGGTDPITNITVIPSSVLDEMTTALAVIAGRLHRPYRSVEGYGMGWERSSFQGHDIISHSGRMPAHLSEVLFLPSDHLGIVALSNADQPQQAHHKVAYRIVEDVLGLPHVSIGQTVAQDDLHPNSSATITLAASLARYAGTYKNAAYGNFTLCAPTTRSKYCARVLADFAACGEREDPALYAAYPRFTSSHIRLTPVPLPLARWASPPATAHENVDSWELEFVSLFPHGYGKDSSPFVYRVLGGSTMELRCTVARGLVEGCGIVDITLDEGRVPRKGSVKETTDVWFDRVD